MKVAVIYGGSSTEAAFSTEEAGTVTQALVRRAHHARMIPYDGTLLGELRAFAPDAAFITVHGKGHGDGTVQGLLDFLGIPYPGSPLLSAAIINDKILCKELFQEAGIRTPAWQTLCERDYRQAVEADALGELLTLPFPFAAKAPTQGDGHGIEYIGGEEDLPKLEAVFAYDDPILLEEFIPGSSVTTGMLQYRGELVCFPAIEAFDREEYEAKKIRLFTRGYIEVKRAPLPQAVLEEIESLSRKVFEVTRSRHYARPDFMVSEKDGLPYCLEQTALPGLRETSFYPYGAALYGLSYDDMVEAILQNALT